MAANKDLARFVRDALSAGHSREGVAKAMADAGWTPTEAKEALSAWSETSFSPPVPRPQTIVTARDFFVYALTFGLLLFVAVYFVVLCHQMIDFAFKAHDNPYSVSTIRWSISTLTVTTPTFLWLTWRDRQALREDPARYRSSIRKWTTYLTLLVASAVLLSDMIVTINAFLSGDFTLQFLAKAAVVAAVAGGVFGYYLADIRRAPLP